MKIKNVKKTGYVKGKNPTDLSGFYVVYYGSTLNEKKGTYGISHLMEHLMCKSFEDLFLEFEKDGISWNAWTANNVVVYYITGLNKYVDKWKKEFHLRLKNFNITQEQLDNEKKIVLEEYKDSFNEQGHSHYLNLFRKVFNIYNPIGLKEDIENVTLDMCKEYFDTYISKCSKIVDISKKKNKEDRKYFNKIEYSKSFPHRNVEYLENNEHYIYQPNNEYKDKTSIILMSKIIKEDFPYIDFITKMLGKGLKSPLYNEIREKRGLVYFVHCYLDNIDYDNAVINISTETSNENVETLVDTVKMVLDNPDKYMTKERFDIIKQSYEIIFEKNKIDQYDNPYKFIKPSKLSLERILGDLTYEDIMEKYKKYFNFDEFYKSYDSKEFETDKNAS